MANRDFIKDALLGIAIGDTLGVPVEFIPRKGLINEPVVSMRAFGTHGQPKGTWSDDSSLTFCLAEMLSHGYNLQDLADRFIAWKTHGYWTPHGQVFDMGIATSSAIYALQKGVSPTLAGGNDEESNGNGSLMRILPLLFYIRHEPIEVRFSIIQDVSSLTHRHIRSVIGCFIYLELALQILNGKDKWSAFELMSQNVKQFLKEKPVGILKEIDKYHRILCNPAVYELDENEIYSSGYILHTLEASIWCLFKTDNYKEAVLKAVNLGNDTDTTGAVTGGLAGLLYGWETIPSEWVEVLARKEDIEHLSKRLNIKLK